MNAENAKKIADQALSTLTDALAQGKSQSLKQYLAMMARFHDYSFRNVCLIAMQFPTATRVAGFHAWKKLGRFVSAGQKGIVIVAPMTIKPKEEASDGKPAEAIMRFRGAYVFDVSQTEGQPLPEISRVAGDPGEFLNRLQAAIRAHGITLDSDVPPGCDGVSRGGRVSIREGLPAAEAFSVTVHELAHELLHRTDATRKGGPAGKPLRETQAEAVAHVVCSAIGLEVGDAARDYIQLYEGDAKILIASLEEVQRAAAKIIEAVTASEESADADADNADAAAS